MFVLGTSILEEEMSFEKIGGVKGALVEAGIRIKVEIFFPGVISQVALISNFFKQKLEMCEMHQDFFVSTRVGLILSPSRGSLYRPIVCKVILAVVPAFIVLFASFFFGASDWCFESGMV